MPASMCGHVKFRVYSFSVKHESTCTAHLSGTSSQLQWNLRSKTTIWAMKSGLIFEVVLVLRPIIHVYMNLELNQSDHISKVVIYREVVL